MAEQRKPLLPVSKSPIGTFGHVGFRPASPKTVALLRSYLRTRHMNEQVREVLLEKLDRGEMSQKEAGDMIARLRHRGRRDLNR